MEEIRQLLALWQDCSQSSADVKTLALARAAELKRKARELDEMRRSLERLATECHGDLRPDCPILHDLEGSSDESSGALEPAASAKVEGVS